MLNNNKKKEPHLGDLLLLFRRNIMEKVKKEGLNQDLTFPQMEILHFIGIKISILMGFRYRLVF